MVGDMMAQDGEDLLPGKAERVPYWCGLSSLGYYNPPNSTHNK